MLSLKADRLHKSVITRSIRGEWKMFEITSTNTHPSLLPLFPSHLHWSKKLSGWALGKKAASKSIPRDKVSYTQLQSAKVTVSSEFLTTSKKNTWRQGTFGATIRVTNGTCAIHRMRNRRVLWIHLTSCQNSYTAQKVFILEGVAGRSFSNDWKLKV